METINYDELVEEYNVSLVNVLRGFRPKVPFIEMWVPDNDHLKSIVNLVETAQVHGEDAFKLKISPATWKGLDSKKLQNTINEFGKVLVETMEEGALMYISDLSGSGDKKQSTESTVPELYREKVEALGNSNAYEKTITANEDDGMIVTRSNVDGTSFFAAIDPKYNVMVDVAYTGARSKVDRAMLEGFCQIVHNTSIQDASDYGVVKLEYSLRNNKFTRPNGGIASPFNIDKMFELPQKLIRSLLEDYRSKAGYKETKNFWYPGASPEWKELTDEQRLAKVQASIESADWDFLPETVIAKAVKVEQQVKVYIQFEGEYGNWEKANALMKMEPYLRNTVEKRIQLYLEPLKDKNRARRL